VNKYALTDFSANYSDTSQECAQTHMNTIMPMENRNIHDKNFNMLSALKENINYSTYIKLYVFAAGGFLSALLFSREGFCPPSHFYRRAFVRPFIFTGGLLSALSFSRRAFVRLVTF
jgi:hypothetical protein